MKKYFYLGALGLILFEIANVYFIMPMPGSQRMNSIGGAYFLYQWRWLFRILFLGMMLVGIGAAFRSSKFFGLLFLVLSLGVVYLANFMMAADSMFLQPKHLRMAAGADNKVDTGRLVIGVEYNGQARAYPIQYLGYHHQVIDTIGGKPLMITYCTVCRTGRVFEPLVNGKPEKFRLVGMDHFNAMFEDATTGSWWRQSNGEAIAGKLKGQSLPEIPGRQVSLHQWLALHPTSLIMQPDSSFAKQYEDMSNYESGKSKSNLTRKDSLSWQEKSWVAGVVAGKASKAYDWNTLQKEHLIYDVLNGQPIVVLLAEDNKSLAALQRTSNDQKFVLAGDTLKDGQNNYLLSGASLTAGVPGLKPVSVYQEYWHSWQTFHPATARDSR